ncbi:MAG: tRNA (adenosine(37)-N6)-dimethylallyltransferase MiaA [Opitutales bacterium]
MKPILHIIAGTTAVGKTEYALRYAEEHNAEIISCDASLFYRGMDIGTAKPTPAERASVPHHMIDICDLREPYDIVNYVEDAKRTVAEICSRGHSVVITGGSGFYLKSFLSPVLDTIQVPDSIREEVEGIFESSGLRGLMEQLHLVNPQGVENLDVNNPRRVMRALERCMASGKSLREIQAEFTSRPEPFLEFSKHIILLEREPEQLNRRIEQRVEAMMREGLVEEVRLLRLNGLEENESAASAIGYRETLAYLKGKLELSVLVPEIVKNTRRLAKKQRTWFRTQLPEADRRICL